MSAVNYAPEFTHTDWIDNVDRVQAAGSNGFNARFHAIEAEFGRLSEVIDQVRQALEKLAQAPPAQPVTTTLTPALVATGDPWQHTFGGATKPGGKSAASGMMELQLPQRSRIQTFRATGEKGSGNLTVSLRRHGLSATATTQLITGLTAGNGPFDISAAAPDTPVSTIDNEQFRYYITAELDGAGGASTVSVNSFQIIHIPA